MLWTAAGLLLILLVLFGLRVCVRSYRNTIKPRGIIIHHAGGTRTPDGRMLNARIIGQIHRHREFSTFYWGRYYHMGYHYLILPDGSIERGRPDRCLGAHARSYNSYLGICLLGDFSSDGERADAADSGEPTEAQMRALTELCRSLRRRYRIPLGHVLGHQDVNPQTVCPGARFPLKQFMRQLEAVQ